MKYTNFGFVLLVLLCVSQASFAQEFIGSKIKLQDPSDVSAKANGSSSSFSSPYSEMFQNPMINSTLQGMGNMMQGYNNDSRGVQEQVKQQMDYAKQQMDQK